MTASARPDVDLVLEVSHTRHLLMHDGVGLHVVVVHLLEWQNVNSDWNDRQAALEQRHTPHRCHSQQG